MKAGECRGFSSSMVATIMYIMYNRIRDSKGQLRPQQRGLIGGLVFAGIWSFTDLADPKFGYLQLYEAQRMAL